LKEWKKLLRGKYRKKEGLFLAEGIRCVEQVVENNYLEVRELIVDNQADLTPIRLPKEIPVYELTSDQFLTISDTETPQGVIAVCKIPDEAEINDLSNTEGVIVALDAIQDPGNLGTIIRTAAWFGVSGIIFGEGCVDPFHPKVVRSTAGATTSVTYLKGDLNSLLDEFMTHGWEIVLMDGSKSSIPLGEYSSTGKTVLVIGNEANGIDSSLFKTGRRSLKITGPTRSVESLNAAIALSIALYSMSAQ
jgi:TrmH family RNA methyltransferase